MKNSCAGSLAPSGSGEGQIENSTSTLTDSATQRIKLDTGDSTESLVFPKKAKSRISPKVLFPDSLGPSMPIRPLGGKPETSRREKRMKFSALMDRISIFQLPVGALGAASTAS